MGSLRATGRESAGPDDRPGDHGRHGRAALTTGAVGLAPGSVSAQNRGMSETGTSEIEFVGAIGQRLSGVLHVPAEPTGSVLLAHCFTCSKELHTMTRLASSLAGRGYAVLRFDFTGLGDSGGEFTDSTVSVHVGDLTRATVASSNAATGRVRSSGTASAAPRPCSPPTG